MDLNKVLSRLRIYPNFLSPHEIEKILSFEQEAQYDDDLKVNQPPQKSQYRSTLAGGVTSTAAQKVYERVYDQMVAWYGDKLLKKNAVESSILIKYYDKEEFTPHIDGGSYAFCHETHKVIYQKKLPRDFNSIIYLNETTGGDLWFPVLNMKIRPTPGTLVAWPSKDIFFLHGSARLESKVKLGLMNFFEDDSVFSGFTEEQFSQEEFESLVKIFTLNHLSIPKRTLSK